MLKILAIDDKRDNLISVSALLKSVLSDCDVLTALSGEEGIRMAAETSPDVILLDIKMPGMDGYEVCERLKADPRTQSIPVLMLTAARTEPAHRIRGLEAGADAFLSKPIDEAELTAQVKVALRIKQSEDALREERNRLEERVEARTRELENVNRELQQVLDSLPEGIVYTDTDRRIIRVNPAFVDIFGYDPTDVLGEDTSILYAEEADFESQGRVRYNVDAKDVHQPYEVQYRRKSGETFPSETVSTSVCDSQDNIVGFLALIRDISDRKLAEDRWHESSRRLRTLVANVPGAVYRCKNDPDWTMQFVSDAIEQITGYSADEFVGSRVRSFASLIHPDDREGVQQAVQQAVSDNRPFGFEYRMLDAGGKIHWVLERGQGVVSETGDVESLQGVIIDITDRKLAEETLAKKEEQYRALFETANDAIFIVEGGRFVDCNSRTLGMYGCGRDEIIGASPYDFSPPVQPDGSDSRTTARAKIEAAMAGTPQRFDWRHQQLDGTPFDAEVSLNLVELPSGSRILAIVRDITDRKEAEKLQREREEQYRALFETANDAIMILDGDTIVDCNSRASELFGYPKGQLVGTTPYQYSPATQPDGMESVTKGREKIAAAMAGEPQRFEWKHTRPDGPPFDVDVSLNLVELPSGSYVQTIVRDMTARKEAEKKLLESEQRVRRKLDAILLPEGDIGELELADIIDVEAVQSLMDDFCEMTGFTVAMIDARGKVLVASNWQDICTQFHRVHPDTCKNCHESDTLLSAGLAPGEFKLYQCKNGLWDIATPLVLGGKHVGNVFTGQFFFRDQEVDTEAFRNRSRQYGFDEEAYMAALARVPRWSREDVDRVIHFYATLAELISKQGYANVRLARTLAERERAQAELKFKSDALENSLNGIILVGEDDKIRYVNRALLDMWQYEEAEELVGKSPVPLSNQPKLYEEIVTNLKRFGRYDLEFTAYRKDGSPFELLMYTRADVDENGRNVYLGTCIDITERKKAEAALRESENKLREAQEMAHLGHWFWDVKTGDVEWSDEVYRIFWLDPNEFTPQIDSIMALSPWPEDHRRNEELMEKLKDDPTPSVFEQRFLRPDGSTGVYFSTCQGVYDDAGELTAVKGTVQDITERKRAEAALIESEEKYRLLADNTVDCIWVINLDTAFTYINPAIESLLGFTPEEWIGTRLADHADEQNLAVMKEVIDDVLKALPEIKAITFEAEMLHKDGRKVPLEITGRVLCDETGQPVGLQGVTRDISERRQAERALRESEEQYRLTVLETGQIVYDYDPASGRLTWFGAVERMTGYTPEEFVSVDISGWEEMLHPDDREATMEALRLSRDECRRFDAIYRFRRKDGEYIHVEEHGVFLPDESGRAVRMLGTMNDVTERRLSEQRLRSVFAAVPTGIIVMVDRVVTEVNDQFCELMGYSREELLGRSSRILYPDDGTYEYVGTEMYARIHRDGTGTMEIPMRHKEGQIVDVLFRAAKLDPKDRSKGYTFTALDITQTKRDREELVATKRMLEAAIAQSPAGILIADAPDVTIRMANQAAFGVRGGDTSQLTKIAVEQHAANWQTFRPDGTPYPSEELPLSRAILRGEITRDVELIIRDESGQDHWVSCNAAPIRDAPGNIIAGIVIFLDMTERKLNENLVRMNVETLERLARKLSLKDILRPLLEQVDAILPGNRSSIQLRSPDGEFLQFLLGPHLPEAWVRYTDPIKVHPRAGSCGAAAFHNKRVVVRDIATDPLWQSVREEALAHGFAACWSEPIRDDAGEVIGTFAVYLGEAREPSDRELLVLESVSGLIATVIQSVRREESLRESEQRFAVLFEKAPLGYQSLDAEGRFLNVNQTWLDAFGYRREAVIGHWFGEFLTESHRDAFRAYFDRFKESGHVSGAEFDMYRADGSRATISFEGRVAHDEAGRFLQTHSILQDVTEQRRAEKALRQSEHMLSRTESIAHVGSWEWDIVEDRVAWSDELFHVFGIDPRRGPLSFNELPSVYPAKEMKRLRDAMETAMAEGEPFSLELQMLRGDGAMRVVFYRGFAERGEDDGPVRLYGFVQDITERKQTEQELREYRNHLEQLVEQRTEEIARRSAELEAANAELEAFSYSVSHDLRAPLRRMDGFSRTVHDNYADLVDERGRHYLERICANARHMGELIDDLLKLSRISRSEMAYERVDLSAIAEKICHELESSEPSRRVRLEIESNVIVEGDARLLEAVLQNLLANAWKFTGRTEEARIEFGVTTNAECDAPDESLPGDARVFFVRDNGAGFDMAYADKLFGPFQRLHRTDEFEGSGIGLATVQRIIRRHGGYIWAHGAVGAGAAFYFVLASRPDTKEVNPAGCATQGAGDHE